MTRPLTWPAVPRSRLANVAIAAAVGAVFLAGLLTHGVVAALLLLVVAGFLVLLSSQAWATIPERGRRMRVVVVAVVLVIALAKLA